MLTYQVIGSEKPHSPAASLDFSRSTGSQPHTQQACPDQCYIESNPAPAAAYVAPAIPASCRRQHHTLPDTSVLTHKPLQIQMPSSAALPQRKHQQAHTQLPAAATGSSNSTAGSASGAQRSTCLRAQSCARHCCETVSRHTMGKQRSSTVGAWAHVARVQWKSGEQHRMGLLFHSDTTVCRHTYHQPASVSRPAVCAT